MTLIGIGTDSSDYSDVLAYARTASKQRVDVLDAKVEATWDVWLESIFKAKNTQVDKDIAVYESKLAEELKRLEKLKQGMADSKHP